MGAGLEADLFGNVRKPLDEASWLPRRLYVDPAIYDVEMQRIHKREWLYCAHVSAIPKPGDFSTLTLLDQPLLIVRGQDDAVRCFYNVCRHRGMAVAEGNGHARQFRCPYHAWAYDTQGQLIEAPMMERTRDFRLCDIRLREVRSEIFHGMVFINFDDDAAALGPRIADLGELISPWQVAQMTPAGHDEFTGDFNWKVLVENAIEGYHIIAAHSESAGGFAPAELSYSTDDGGRAWHDLYTPYVTSIDVKVAGAQIPGLPSWARERGTFLSLHPQFMITLNPDNVGIVAITPLGPQRTRFDATVFMPRERTRSDASIGAFLEWAKVINREDEQVCKGVQRGVNSDGWSPPRYSHLEKSVWQFHNWYLDRMVGRRAQPVLSRDAAR